MKDEEIIREYYESEISKMPDLVLSPVLLKQGIIHSTHPKKIGWEDLIGALVTLGYLTQLLIPANWFSLGRFLFMFRFGF
jgi:hypothetical protein